MQNEPDNIRIETLTGFLKESIEHVTQSFYDDGAISVQCWEEPPGSALYTVRAVFPAD